VSNLLCSCLSSVADLHKRIFSHPRVRHYKLRKEYPLAVKVRTLESRTGRIGLVIAIDHTKVTNVFRYCIRSDTDYHRRIFSWLSFLAVQSREKTFCTNRYVYSSQELREQVLVLAVDYIK